MTTPNPERAFLHDISNPISIAYGMIEIVVATLEANPGQNTREVERLKKSLNALERTVTLIKERKKMIAATPEGGSKT
jgi:hypothetical protein